MRSQQLTIDIEAQTFENVLPGTVGQENPQRHNHKNSLKISSSPKCFTFSENHIEASRRNELAKTNRKTRSKTVHDDFIEEVKEHEMDPLDDEDMITWISYPGQRYVEGDLTLPKPVMKLKISLIPQSDNELIISYLKNIFLSDQYFEANDNKIVEKIKHILHNDSQTTEKKLWALNQYADSLNDPLKACFPCFFKPVSYSKKMGEMIDIFNILNLYLGNEILPYNVFREITEFDNKNTIKLRAW